MKVTDKATTESGILTNPRGKEYRFGFVRRNGHEDLFMFRRIPTGPWTLMAEHQSRAERDYLWQVYHRAGNLLADDVDEDHQEDEE